jgi:Baseplate J-like protein
VRTLLDRPIGVRAAHNPAPTGIGVDAETPELTRANIPNTVRTFGRIVSLRDFEDAAREAAAVAKARATWEWDGEVQAVHLTVAGEDGIAIVGDALAGLVADLDARRDPNRRLVVRPHVPVPVEVKAVVRVHPDYLARDVVPAAQAALADYFSFASRNFGEPAHLSDVYRVLQDVPGVVSADVDVLRFKPFAPPAAYARFVRERGGTFHLEAGVERPDAVQAHLLVRGSELVVLAAPEDATVREG